MVNEAIDACCSIMSNDKQKASVQAKGRRERQDEKRTRCCKHWRQARRAKEHDNLRVVVVVVLVEPGSLLAFR
jgi:hypothetical protein